MEPVLEIYCGNWLLYEQKSYEIFNKKRIVYCYIYILNITQILKFV